VLPNPDPIALSCPPTTGPFGAAFGHVLGENLKRAKTQWNYAQQGIAPTRGLVRPCMTVGPGAERIKG
jgi:hypothetical protein